MGHVQRRAHHGSINTIKDGRGVRLDSRFAFWGIMWRATSASKCGAGVVCSQVLPRQRNPVSQLLQVNQNENDRNVRSLCRRLDSTRSAHQSLAIWQLNRKNWGQSADYRTSATICQPQTHFFDVRQKPTSQKPARTGPPVQAARTKKHVFNLSWHCQKHSWFSWSQKLAVLVVVVPWKSLR